MSFNGDLNASDEGTDLTTKGDLHGFSTENIRVPVGTDSYILSAASGETTGLEWVANTDAGLTLGSKGDIHTRSASDQAALAVGANLKSLYANSAETTGLEWNTNARETLTAAGDILYASGANTLARLAKGSDTNVLTLASGVPSWAAPAGGGWENLGSTVLTSSGDTITVSSFSSKKYLHMEFLCLTTGGNTMPSIKFNSSGSDTDYAIRDSQDGGTDDTQTGQTEIRLSQGGHGGTVGKFYGTLDIINVAAEEKLVIGFTNRTNADGSGTAPARYQLVAKYVDTNAITTAQLVNNGTGDFDVESSLIVFGRDD